MCYGRTNVQPGDSIESTLLWQRRLKKEKEKTDKQSNNPITIQR